MESALSFKKPNLQSNPNNSKGFINTNSDFNKDMTFSSKKFTQGTFPQQPQSQPSQAQGPSVRDFLAGMNFTLPSKTRIPQAESSETSQFQVLQRPVSSSARVESNPLRRPASQDPVIFGNSNTGDPNRYMSTLMDQLFGQPSTSFTSHTGRPTPPIFQTRGLIDRAVDRIGRADRFDHVADRTDRFDRADRSDRLFAIPSHPPKAPTISSLLHSLPVSRSHIIHSSTATKFDPNPITPLKIQPSLGISTRGKSATRHSPSHRDAEFREQMEDMRNNFANFLSRRNR